MSTLNTIRIAVQILSTLFVLVAIGFTAASVLSTGWQIMSEPGTGEIHQHGLWFDYVFATRSHTAGMPYPAVPYGGGAGSFESRGYGGFGGYGGYGYGYGPGEWIMTYKFGDAVYGNEVHRAQPYQVNALVLLCLTLLTASAGLVISYCASVKVLLAMSWAILLFLAVILEAAGLIQFYVNSMLPEYRFVYTDRRIEQFVGYAFWWAVVGVTTLILAMVTSVVCAILLVMMNRRGEKPNRALCNLRRGNQPITQTHIATISEEHPQM